MPLKGQYGMKTEVKAKYGIDILDLDSTRYQWVADTRPVMCDPAVYYSDGLGNCVEREVYEGLKFNGDTLKVEFEQYLIAGFSVWVYCLACAPSTPENFIELLKVLDSNGGNMKLIYSTNDLGTTISVNGSLKSSAHSTIQGKWSLLKVYFKEQSYSISVNGLAEDVQMSNSPLVLTSSLYLGSSNFIGYFRDISIYNDYISQNKMFFGYFPYRDEFITTFIYSTLLRDQPGINKIYYSGYKNHFDTVNQTYEYLPSGFIFCPPYSYFNISDSTCYGNYIS